MDYNEAALRMHREHRGKIEMAPKVAVRDRDVDSEPGSLIECTTGDRVAVYKEYFCVITTYKQYQVVRFFMVNTPLIIS